VFPETALRRLDSLLARAVERVQELGAGAPGSDPFRGLYLSHDDVTRSLVRPAGEPLGVNSSAVGDAELGGGFASLAAAFGLSDFDLDLLLIALAPELDLRYERVYAYLQDDVSRRRPSVDLALSLLTGSAEEKLLARVRLTPSAPLVRHGLVDVVADGTPAPPLLARPLVVDEQIVSALLGVGGLDRRCAAFTALAWPRRSFERLPERRQVEAALDAGLPLRLALSGRGGQQAVAEAVATALDVPLVVADMRRLAADSDTSRALRLVFRERWLRGAVLLLDAVEAFDDTRALASQLAADAGVVILSSRECWRAPLLDGAGTLGLVQIELGALDDDARRVAWTAAGVELPRDDLDALAERFVLSEAQIAEATASACSSGRAVTRESLFAAARALSAQSLGKLAAKVTPGASWDELVVPDEVLVQLRELASWVTQRHQVLGEWGFGRRLRRGRGATALFAGAAGTGKTLAAEVVAAELGLDLYRIDLSGVVSKYIGETEKNLDRIFHAAEDANAVLFFDEADALFGKRSEVNDAHDRYANIEISYLLQKMEAYEGVAILATNLRDNLDPAFVRRLAFIVTFPFPEEEERRRIWDIVWPAETPLADDVDLDALAATQRLSGGQIKNAALAAAYLAACNGGVISQEHLEHALRREYEKSGRAFADLEVVG
jgi:ATPase family associated with various cellular activities (AAA)